MLYVWKRELLEEGAASAMSKKKGNSPSDDRDELICGIELLQQRIHELQLEHDILKKANELLRKVQGISPQDLTNQEKTLLIDALSPTYRLSKLLEQPQMARSSYFYHRACLRLPEKYAGLRQTIIQVFYANNKKSYGYRRVQMTLHRDGIQVSEKVVRRIMVEEALIVSTRRRRRYSLYTGEISPAVESVVNRDFHADAPN